MVELSVTISEEPGSNLGMVGCNPGAVALKVVWKLNGNWFESLYYRYKKIKINEYLEKF